MGQKYTSQSASGYNASPPPDDGTTVAANKVTWASIKSKLADVLNTFIAAVNSQLVTALDYSATTTSVNYTTLVGDHQKPIECTGTITISLGDATTMAVGYQVPVFNKGTGLVTVTPITGTDTLNGTAGASVILPPFTGALFCVNQAANGYNIQDASSPYRQGADIASAATVNLRTATGDYVNITGTTTITAITLDKGAERTVQFSGILTLTNGASLILPGAANITTAAGDMAVFRGEAAGVVRCIVFTKANGSPVRATTWGSQAFSGSGTFTTPANTLPTSQFKFTVIGGGGSGASSGATGAGGSGGNSGATAIYYVSGLAASQNVTVTVGAGGTAPAAGTNNGNAGGNSSVVVGATTVTANGGAGGQSSVTAQASNAAAAATASNGTISIQGAQGAIGSPYNAALFGGGQGAPSSFGGGGAAGPAGNNGQSATAHGSGGGGAGTHATLNFAGGAGAQGIVMVEWVI